MTNPSPPVGLVLSQVRRWEAKGAALIGAREEGIRELHVEATHRCDMRCVMCHHWMMRGGRGLSIGELRRIVSDSRLLGGVRTVVVTGGEPWLHPEAPEMVAFLRSRFPAATLGVLTHMASEGLLRSRLAEVRRRGASGLWLGSSLDGVGEAHDRMRGRPGAFSGLERSLDMLRREFPDIAVSLNFTITPDNVEGLWPAYRYAKGRGLGFGAQLVVEHEGLPAVRRFRWTKAGLSRAAGQIDRIMEDLCRVHGALARLAREPEGSRWLWVQLSCWSHLRDLCAGEGAPMPDCLAGRRYAMLDPEGYLFFCPVYKNRRVGCARGVGLDRLWDSSLADALRRELGRCRRRCWLNCVAHPVLDRVLAAALEAQAPVPR